MFPTLKLDTSMEATYPKLPNQEEVLLKMKQKQWNERFAVGGGIPDYSPIKDRHAQSYRKILQSSEKRTTKDQIDDYDRKRSIGTAQKYQKRLWSRKKNAALNQRLQIDNIQNNMRLNGFIRQLQKSWFNQQIPDFYGYYFMNQIKGLDPNTLQEILIKQIRNIKNKQSYYHEITNSIEARQACILQIIKGLQSLENLKYKQRKMSQTISDLVDKKLKILKDEINHFRRLNIFIIDKIEKWRTSLKNLSDRQLNQTPIFYYKDMNYLIKILNDTKFISNSFLTNYLNFTVKNDPFLLWPLKSQKNQNNKRFFEIFQIDQQIKQHLYTSLQYLAGQKAEQLREKINVNRIKEKTIQKTYKADIERKKLFTARQYSSPKNFDLNKSLQKQRQRLERIQKNKQKINSIKTIYEPKKLMVDGFTDTENDIPTIKPNKPIIDRREPKGIKRAKSVGINKYTPSKNKLLNYDQETDFDAMVKNKQLQIMKKQKYFSKTNTLSNKKTPADDNQVMQELQRIVDNYNKANPKIQEGLENNKNQLDLKKFNQSKDKYSKLLQKKGVGNFPIKQNAQLVKELKNEILQKLQKQSSERQKMKRLKRQDEQLIIDAMKQKMRKQLQQRIKQQRKKKQIEKQVLQKKLKYQETKLINQKQFQLSLQMKLNKEKDLAQIQKIKNKTLQKQNLLKSQIAQESKNIANKALLQEFEKKQKLRLIQQLSKKGLQQNVQEELKRSFRQKIDKDINFEINRSEQQNLRKQKKQQLEKQLKILKIKEALQLEKLKKQTQLRDKMLRQRMEQQQRKKIQLQKLLKQSMQNQRNEWENFQNRKKNVQQEYMESLRQKISNERKNQQDYEDIQNKKMRQKEIEQQTYRQKIKEKIERQMRIQVIQRTKRQIDDRQLKKKQISYQLEKSQKKNLQNILIPLHRDKIQSEVKKQFLEKALIEKKMDKQIAKKQLRQQFQKQLLGSTLPQFLHKTQDFLVKNINGYKEDAYLKLKLEQQQKLNVENQSNEKQIEKLSNSNLINPITHNQLSDSKLKTQSVKTQKQLKLTSPNKIQKIPSTQIKSQKSDRLGMTPQNYQIYLKKKKNLLKVQQQKYDGSNQELIEQDTQQQYKLIKINRKAESLMKKQQTQQKKQNSDKKTKKQKQSKQQKIRKSKMEIVQQSQNQYVKKKIQNKNEQQQQDSQQKISQKKFDKTKDKNKKKNKKIHNEEKTEVKSIKKKKYKKQSSQEEEDQKKEKKQRSQSQQQSNKKSRKLKSRKKQRQFQTSDQQQNSKIKSIKKKKISQHQSSQEQKSKKQSRIIDNNQQIGTTQTFNKKINEQNKKQKFTINLDAINQFQLDEYLSNHFSKIPKLQLDICVFKRQQLYRKLLDQLTFNLLVGKQDKKITGLCIAHHDRNKHESRKFVISHISTYNTTNQFQFILNACRFIFRKDPCDQIEFFFRYDQQNQQQLQFCNKFNSKFDKYGGIFQKKIADQIYQRKYVMKRPFNLKCEITLGSQSKHSFVNLFSVYSSVIFSNLQLFQNKQQNILSKTLIPERQISYSIMMAQIFRTCLTSDEAQILKQKVKQFLKLKELLVLVVMLQKKKVKLQEMKLSEFKSLTQLNMKLMSQGKQLVKMVKDSQGALNRIFNCELNQSFRLPFHFQTATLPLEFKDHFKHINYFRLSSLNPHKIFIIKSSLYNGQMHVLPTQNPKYKIFIMSANQFNQVKNQNNLDLFMYVRVFLKNVKSHNVSNWKYVWLPQMITKGYWSIRQFKSFLDKDVYAYDSVNISYRQFLPGALIIKPQHKDLVITPPFIVGILSVTLEQVSQGSPLYVRYIDQDALKAVQTQSKVI